MSDIVFNIAKGRVAELWNRVNDNDPTNSAIVIVPVDRGAVTDATLKDLDTLAAVLASVTEVTTNGWARVTLTDADLSGAAVDDTNDRNDAAFDADVSLGSPTSGSITDLVVCYDSDTTAGTDSAIVPLTIHAFPVTADGSAVVVNAGDVYRAS